MPLFGKKGSTQTKAPPPPQPEDVHAQEFGLKLIYGAKSSDGIRIKAGPRAVERLPDMLGGLTRTDVELIEPLPVEFTEASPVITKPEAAREWLAYHGERTPIARHALLVLESCDAIDLAFDTVCISMLDGETDTSGTPLFDAIVGGVASHWDEATGDMIVRAVVGWGGRGIRGDTERNAGRLLSGLFQNVLADKDALGVIASDRAMPQGGGGGVVCAHCGFASAHERAFYCPKCGMRLLRG